MRSRQSQSTSTFPSVRIPSRSGGLPIEIVLVSQLDPGAGNRMIQGACARQRAHAAFVDALDEPSVKLADSDLRSGETTALYSFAVGRDGHPFHRHAGHRVFTAISGSGGTQLRFSTASASNLATSPKAFVDAMHWVNIPPDCLFTVRFGGGTWHQFLPLREKTGHPALFALSCHTDETGGIADPAMIAQIADGKATIASLTEVLPEAVLDYLRVHPVSPDDVATTSLSLDAPAGSALGAFCGVARHAAGMARGAIGAVMPASGFVGRFGRNVVPLERLSADSLLAQQLASGHDHEDMFLLTVRRHEIRHASASGLLAEVLEGFLVNRPAGVSGLMRLRNILVKPLRLRTSPLGCPVSSLLSGGCSRMFAGKYPVLDQSVDAHDQYAQVVLGADDRHLRFRSCVGVRVSGDEIHVTLGTRVQCTNIFGCFYMAVIAGAHRNYVSPAMLGMAVDHAVERSEAVGQSGLLTA